ncbi:MAG: LytR/AlgR family response regulator transcription factor [Ekhidna sp.]
MPEERLQIYVVEDEAITRATIKSYLKKANYELIGSADEAEKAWLEIQNLKVDLAILDINLIGDKDGIWLAGKLQESGLVPFIFLTAYGDKQTIDAALSVKPNGYLVKPFEEAELYTAIRIGINSFANQIKSDSLEKENHVINDNIFIKDDHLLVKLNIKEILFVKSDGNYLEIHLQHKKHLVRSKLNDFIERLPKNTFLKVHQRYIINIEALEIIGSGFVKVAGIEIPVSKSYKDILLNRIRTL